MVPWWWWWCSGALVLFTNTVLMHRRPPERQDGDRVPESVGHTRCIVLYVVRGVSSLSILERNDLVVLHHTRAHSHTHLHTRTHTHSLTYSNYPVVYYVVYNIHKRHIVHTCVIFISHALYNSLIRFIFHFLIRVCVIYIHTCVIFIRKWRPTNGPDPQMDHYINIL